MDSLMPMACRRSRILSARGGSTMMAFSVISSVRCAAGTAHLANSPAPLVVGRRQVDRDVEGEAELPPGPALPQGLGYYPIGEGPDQVALLGERNEIGGRDETMDRVAPTQQRLH